jgi:NitT/TauT family transport system permease protein
MGLLPGRGQQTKEIAMSPEVTTPPVTTPARTRRRRPTAETIRVNVLRVVLIVVLLLVWQYFGGRSQHSMFFYSQPSAIWSGLTHLLGGQTFWTDLRYTMEETVVGFLIGGIAGIVLGFGLAFAKTAYRVLDPIMNALNALPRIALSSLFILWFGLGMESKIALVTSLVFFPLFLNAYAGASTIDPDQALLMRTMRASRLQFVRKVTFPATAPWVITGAKLGVAQALGGAVIGELIASQHGLGAELNSDATSFNTADEFAILLILIVLALILNGIFTVLENRTASWR